MDTEQEIRDKISLKYSIKDLIEQDLGLSNASMIPCPFHHDENPSAKFFENDSDGIIKLFCFGCQKQYTSYDYFKKKGVKLIDLLDENDVTPQIKVEEISFESIEGFIEGKLTLNAYLNNLINL